MEGIIQLEHYYHRSKERVKDLGEVFTPEYYVEEMLKLLSTENDFSWSNEEIVFFEPCCGNGNIVIAIFLKRAGAFYTNSILHNKREYAAYYAVANTIHSLWAIDIDPENIAECRTRLFKASIKFLLDKLQLTDFKILIGRDRDYLAHLLCAIQWHIHENEMLSAVTHQSKLSRSNAQKTKLSAEWVALNKHHPIDFDLTWIDFFEKKLNKNIIPLVFKQAIKFLESQNGQGSDKFDFARTIFTSDQIVRSENQYVANKGEATCRQI
ncbi:hypothetical protein [Legionella bononiensis]|uniref:site-specific DNA-methyltransferase (adenine-specific) n=1 Tax=Legionella bononiensis TaxID=2793102 RepID=A0ABS1WC89_9GAMM|nr:hypothetical protein [Legionella bononiensis]MBL7478773.1 hypothetical protein [Legionella bononiensis]MBL7526981.1 hypothetical protein [Legionella bononiensis]MBL7562504.1 hypothetical protein [Legionella bononiensis]HAT8068391.1 hypothetical protein [Legionella pneumophila]